MGRFNLNPPTFTNESRFSTLAMNLLKQFISDLNGCGEQAGLNTSRGHATREKLLTAGLALFGQRGYEAVSARELAKLAGTPLSAITYHFSTMDALYKAVIVVMLEHIASRISPPIKRISEQVATGSLSPALAIDQVTAVLISEIVCCKENAEWPMLMIREHITPGPAFDIIYYNGTMLDVHELLAQLFAAVRGANAKDPDIELSAFAHMGKVLSFRMLSAALMRRMAWSEYGQTAQAAITQAVAFRP
jgi:TetR/AcrR family transcriptional regulator, regulator of cefoperazone and chloramphenicol sensitivity